MLKDMTCCGPGAAPAVAPSAGTVATA